MSGRSPVGFGLYFIDVLACLLFCITLSLVGARFSRETTVPVDLPELGASGAATSPAAVSVTITSESGRTHYYLEDREHSFESLRTALRTTPPAALRIRAEETALARVIGLAHESGIHDIELAYETRTREPAARRAAPGAARGGN